MTDADFKLFDVMRKRHDDVVCKHENVIGGTCDNCYEVLHWGSESELDSYSRASFLSVSKHNRVSHFIKVLRKLEVLKWGEESAVVSDFEDFIWAFDRIDKGGRKNFLLNGWVLWKILERGIECERYEIKNAKSKEDHERLGRLVFDKLGW